MKGKMLLLSASIIFLFFIAISHAQESVAKRKTLGISTGTDDAEEDLANGTMYLAEENLELCYHAWSGGGRNQIIGLRFPKLSLPADVIIDSAHLQFFSKGSTSTSTSFTITGEVSLNSEPFSSSAYNISSRHKTVAKVTWAVPAWGGWGEQGLNQRSPDISSVVKEIVAQNGFSSSSPVTIFLQGSGTRIAQAFEGDPFMAPKLLINYRLLSATPSTVPYKDRYSNQFPIGTSMSAEYLGNLDKLGGNNIFNRLTAESSMKWSSIQPEYNKFTFEKGDALADYVRSNNMKMTGHTLLWHQGNPDWLFKNGPDGSVSSSVLSLRLKNHIDKMVERYGDVVDNWDVVNEAISDLSTVYREDSEGSLWWSYFKSPEFIKLAFQYAAEANAKYGRSSLLFYNDYNVPDSKKIGKILQMIDYLKSSGVQIDGVGFQGHWQLNDFSISQIRAAFDKIIAKGLKIKISELDISIYNYYTKDYSAPLTAACEQEQAYRYQELFDLFREYKDHIHSVTIWGLTDGPGTWLSYNRQTWELLPQDQWDYPLLFDQNFNPKKALYAIMDFADSGQGGGTVNQPPTAVLKAHPTSGNAPLTVSFDGSDSFDSDGTIAEHSWFFGDGGYGAGESATRIYKTAGTYPVSLTVKDNTGNVDSEAAVITVGPDLTKVITVQDISISTVKSGDSTAAQVTVLILNASGQPVSGVRVYGTWSNGLVSGNVSGLTDVNGLVTLTSSYTTKKGAITFTVNNLLKTGFLYDGCQNQKTSASVNVN
uniref:endo-1,4-beta-xylanase n=1 Tax=Candidatus Electronema sp. TaxID=2698783 RepID=UPI0040577F1D